MENVRELAKQINRDYTILNLLGNSLCLFLTIQLNFKVRARNKKLEKDVCVCVFMPEFWTFAILNTNPEDSRKLLAVIRPAKSFKSLELEIFPHTEEILGKAAFRVFEWFLVDFACQTNIKLTKNQKKN